MTLSWAFITLLMSFRFANSGKGTVNVYGCAYCNGNPLRYVKVKMYDMDPIINTFMDKTVTDENGCFLLNGSASDLRSDIDPVINFYHKCPMWIQFGSCLLKSRLVLNSSEVVNVGSVHLTDIEVTELETTKDCTYRTNTIVIVTKRTGSVIRDEIFIGFRSLVSSTFVYVFICGNIVTLLYSLYFIYTGIIERALHSFLQNGLPLDYVESMHLDCEPVIENTEDVVKYRHWTFDFQIYEDELYKSSNICEAINQRFYFEKRPLSKEEEEYPLAFGLVLYKNIVQVLLELSIFYHPQNAYCITVDRTAHKDFKKIMTHLPKCFKNIKVFIGKRSQWGSYGVLDNVYQCFKYLAHSKHNWKYYQYLSGSDLPLRTNLEMVRIMKALNGSINSDIDEFEMDRYRTMEGIHPPLPLYKSAMSVAMPRAAANYIVRSEKVKRLLRYLSNTWIPDESFWTSVAGNAPLLRVPGSFRARDIIWLRKHLSANLPWQWTTSSVGTTYIGRYQVWEWQKVCMGQIRAWSCVFGAMDVAEVINRPELIVHKLDIEFEPAAFMCIMKEIRYRSHYPIEFDATSYSEMPTVELYNGKRITELTHPDWLLLSSFYRL